MSLARTTDPFVALGYLSGSDNRPRRDQIRLVSRPFADGGVVYRFVMAMAESAGEHSAATLKEARAAGDIVMLNVSDTPFRCALKYVLWTAWARDAFPSARYLASGDDDAYVQLAHLEADLRLAHAQVGEVAAYYGCIMWRPYYNNVTQDASTGFTGWTCADGQAAGVRRGMEACAKQAAAKPAVRALRTKAELAPDAPACAGLAANEKRLNAILSQQVDWDLPPFPMANGPLFAVSRPLAGHPACWKSPPAGHMHMALSIGPRARFASFAGEEPFPAATGPLPLWPAPPPHMWPHAWLAHHSRVLQTSSRATSRSPPPPAHHSGVPPPPRRPPRARPRARRRPRPLGWRAPPPQLPPPARAADAAAVGGGDGGAHRARAPVPRLPRPPGGLELEAASAGGAAAPRVLAEWRQRAGAARGVGERALRRACDADQHAAERAALPVG